ncbi:MAG: hypothetical protein C0619_01200 [Desulfuromonas sp.]|nr:MAG: hypothetical protein C0619_01200 [Desulfuromonas sp.]
MMNYFFKVISLSSLLFFGLCLSLVNAETTTLYQSVERALNNSPELEALQYDRQALQFDLKAVRGRYLPKLDLSLGYGLEQYSDDLSRKPGADPADDDWDSLGRADLKLTQNLYSGGETRSRVSIQEAVLDSANFQLQAIAQSIALDAVAAHLDVYRLRKVVALAEMNLAVHEDIQQSLAEREKAGAGSIADVTLASARQARAEAILSQSQEELARALANYARVVGGLPGPLGYAGVPESMPQSLDDALLAIEQSNPELQALEAGIAEADSRVELNRSSYKPKIDIELKSDYSDQLEGSRTWQRTDEAMLNLTWNLFNGGQDQATVSSSMERKLQSRSARKVRLNELTEEATVTWTQYHSLQRQKRIYRDAVEFSRQTFDAYLKQFSVSQRSLLDVLSAEDDYFQASRQLANVASKEILAAYRLQSLTGSTVPPEGDAVEPDYLKESVKPMVDWSLASPEAADASDEVIASQENIGEFLERWTSAWKRQNVSDYLACYSSNFMPENEVSYQAWLDQRQERLKTPAFIAITVTDLRIETLSETVSRAVFIQDYTNDFYSDRTEKSLLLELKEQGWMIVRERAKRLF